MTPDWITFFTTLTQVSIGLAGLLFISFSIYISNRTIDLLEVNIGTGYYIEAISAFIISLFAILPPHWWWFGAGTIAIFYVWYTIKSEKEISKYRNEYRKFYDDRGTKKSDKQKETPSKKAEIYKLYKLQSGYQWIFWIRTILLLLLAVIGCLFTFNVPLLIFKISLASQLAVLSIALYFTGFLTALYLVSCVIGAWIFFLKFENRNKVIVDLADSEVDPEHKER